MVLKKYFKPYISELLKHLTKIFLSREKSALQSKVLAKIAFIGNKRLPLLAIDSLENYKKIIRFRRPPA